MSSVFKLLFGLLFLTIVSSCGEEEVVPRGGQSELFSFSFTDPLFVEGEIDPVTRAIQVIVPDTIRLDSMRAVVQVSDQAIVNPDISDYNDYSSRNFSFKVVGRITTPGSVTITDSTEYEVQIEFE